MAHPLLEFTVPEHRSESKAPSIQLCNTTSICRDKVENCINNIKPRSSTRPDKVSPRLLKPAGNVIVPSLAGLYVYLAFVL